MTLTCKCGMFTTTGSTPDGRFRVIWHRWLDGSLMAHSSEHCGPPTRSQQSWIELPRELEGELVSA